MIVCCENWKFSTIICLDGGYGMGCKCCREEHRPLNLKRHPLTVLFFHLSFSLPKMAADMVVAMVADTVVAMEWATQT